jgi:hypothetical protein
MGHLAFFRSFPTPYIITVSRPLLFPARLGVALGLQQR